MRHPGVLYHQLPREVDSDGVPIVRTAEEEADLYGLNAAREPHGFAAVAMRLSTYRKLAPSPLEEMLFFDHPSGRSRVTMAMRWFKEHPDGGVAGTRAPSR